MFKSLNGLAPVYLKDLFRERHTDYEMHDSLRKLNLPKPLTDHLRVPASKYRESAESKENSDFLLLRQKDPFGELFSEIYFQSSSEFTFL